MLPTGNLTFIEYNDVQTCRKERIWNMKKIAVIFGGCSSEYEVSLQSAYAVLKNMDQSRYQPVAFGITREGDSWLYEGEIEKIPADTWQKDQACYPAGIRLGSGQHGFIVQKAGQLIKYEVDAAFPVLHGKNGEDGTVQGTLALSGIPVIGCGVLASAVCMNKDMAHRLAEADGIRVPKSKVLTEHNVEAAKQEAGQLGYPVFVKPLRAGSSFGITKVTGPGGLKAALALAFSHDASVVMEEMIPGFEVGCAVLGTREPAVGEVDEIELSEGFFNYEEKYTLKTSKIHVPARIPEEKAREVKETAKRIYRCLGCTGFARVDLFLTPQGEIYFNEVNTIPGFTEHSRYPGMMKAAGVEFQELLNRLISDVL